MKKIALAAVLGWTALLFADGHAAEPRVGPAPAADPLAWTVGRWEGTRTEAATGESARLRSEISSVLGGAGTEERIEVEEGTPPYMGLYLEVADAAGKRSTVVYVNARRRNFSRLEGTATERGGEWTSVTAAAPHGSKMRIERTGEDAWRRTQMVSEDDGRTWSVLFVDDMRRAHGAKEER